MVDGVLYLWALQRGTAACMVKDHGRTWNWSPWKFSTSFGCPTFLNFGQNYAGARDGSVYVFSHDGNGATTGRPDGAGPCTEGSTCGPRILCEFFMRIDDRKEPIWSDDIGRRDAVFRNPGECYRNGITYNASLKRYCDARLTPTAPIPRECVLKGDSASMTPGAMGAVDDCLFDGALGCRSGRDQQLSDEVDERRRQDALPGLFGRRPLFGPQATLRTAE